MTIRARMIRSKKPRTRLTQEVTARGTWLWNWWRQFRSEFYVAHPEKQVEQLYYITATLAVMVSVIAGLWAFGKHFWFEKSAAVPQYSTVTPEATVTTQAIPAPSLSVVV